MSSSREIKSEKILVKNIFSALWFRIPEYQRPYLWGYEQVNDLLDDLTFAMSNKPDFEYFLGSFVFQSKTAEPIKGQAFDENDLLDGQQRMVTLLMLFGVIRDLAQDPQAKKDCQGCIYQESSKYKNVPERTRIVFTIREEAQSFVDQYVKIDGATGKEDALLSLSEKAEDLSTRNMAKAVLEIRKFFREKRPPTKPEELLKFLLNKALLIYVSTEDLEDAFRLFTILNDRGIPLRNSDILKAINLGALESQQDKVKYAKMWEQAEGELGDNFDRFLNYVRTILVKDKARLSLLKEFEDKIYDPTERDRTTNERKPRLLSKGTQTFELVEKYFHHYRTLLESSNYDETGKSFAFDNLVRLMLTGLPATDWVPPLMRYFDRFGYERLMEFLKRLDNKFSADWICQYTPTERIESMNAILKTLDDAKTLNDVLNSESFNINKESFIRVIGDSVYGKRFTFYVLLKLDYLFHNHDLRMHFETLSVEHILPQKPADDSQWVKDFTLDQRTEWTDRLGNLVLITGRKNSSQGRLDYNEKKERYFNKCIDTCPNSLRVLQHYNRWGPQELETNHNFVTSKLLGTYGILDGNS